MTTEEEASPMTYEDLAQIEDEFDQVDTEIMRQQYDLSAPLFAKRSLAASQIPNFWPLVLEQAPLEIDQYVQPQDSRIFAESLLNVEVRRPELDVGNGSGTGNPRSVSIRLEFRPNDDFEDASLEKTFYFRRAKDGVNGLVSEPVKIHWKKGKDLTEGLTDGAVALWVARKKLGDMTAKGMPEYTALKKKVESWNGMNTSFFTWFGWVSARRWISAEESESANEAHAKLKARRKAGGSAALTEDGADEMAEEDEAGMIDAAVEVHEAGEELAIAFAEDLWPNAIKYFTQAQEVDEISDVDFEEDDDDEEAEDDVGEGPVDIRALVTESKGRPRDSTGSNGRPSKKQKK